MVWKLWNGRMGMQRLLPSKETSVLVLTHQEVQCPMALISSP